MDLFPEWDEPIDEAELQAIESAYIARTAAAAAASDRTFTSPAAAAAGGGGGSDARARRDLHRDQLANGRRLPNWATTTAAAAPASSSWPASFSPHPRQGGACSLSPCKGQAHSKFKYPAITFGGDIIYSKTAHDVERATRELLETINSRKQGGNLVPIGFDIEWKPTFKRGEIPRKAAVIQLCADKRRCYVMHIIHSGIPSILHLLLGDNSSVKVGVGIANDATKMRNDYNAHVKDVEDLSSLANRKLGGAPKQWSLSSLTEMLTCKQLAKPKRIRLGNWEAKTLSKEQLVYAATDAFVSWYLYEALALFPDANTSAGTAQPAAVPVDAV